MAQRVSINELLAMLKELKINALEMDVAELIMGRKWKSSDLRRVLNYANSVARSRDSPDVSMFDLNIAMRDLKQQ